MENVRLIAGDPKAQPPEVYFKLAQDGDDVNIELYDPQDGTSTPIAWFTKNYDTGKIVLCLGSFIPVRVREHFLLNAQGGIVLDRE